MIINKLTLQNFRQFLGKQELRFSNDPKKKMTLLIAESGVGKTTILRSFEWIFYGKCKYSKVLNDSLRSSMEPGKSEYVICSVEIQHDSNTYTITRTQKFTKANTAVTSLGSELSIEWKDNGGLSKQVRGSEATKFIKNMLHQDLYPYFFLEGENLTKVGSQMSKGKSGSDAEFVKAIKGLLGFNHLYEAQKHLNSVCYQYQQDIRKSTTDIKLAETISEIEKCDGEIKKAKDRISNIEKDIDYYQKEKELLSSRISSYGEAYEKQKRSKKLAGEIEDLNSQIVRERVSIFKHFSSSAFNVVLDSLIPDAENALANSDCIKDGVPGVNVDTIKTLLNNKRCLCGNCIKEDSKEWNLLEKLLDQVPPNNIGYEISSFKRQIGAIKNASETYLQDLEDSRKRLHSFIENHDKKIDEYNELRKDISSISEDVGSLKDKEKEYEDLIFERRLEKHKLENQIISVEGKKATLESDRNRLSVQDQKIAKLRLYHHEATSLNTRIYSYCQKKELEKKTALAAKINSLFADFYNEKIEFSLDSNYGVKIKMLDSELSEDFTSGGQDVAVALAFIGSIVQLNKEKDLDAESEDIGETQESYPLVLDAPVSNFGMKQIDSFSKLIPMISDQVIVLINDVGGPILNKEMDDQIGSRWTIKKIDSYHSELEEVKYGY